jgi:glycosyltransferase involved in cell wall biosynthesis
MKLKKIIIFYPSFERGGVEIVLVNLINFFLKKKIKIILISSNFFNVKLFNNPLFEYRKFNHVKNFFPDRISKAFQASNLLINEFKKTQPNQTVVFSLQSSSISILLSKIFGFKIVVRNAEDPIYSTFFADNKLVASIILIFKFMTYSLSNGIITNSIGSKKSMNKLVFLKNKIVSIYNPYLKKNSKIKVKKRKNIILAVGRLTKQKDLRTLIKAFDLMNKKIRNYKLIILGDGENRKELQFLINKLNLKKKIEIKGWTTNLKKYYTSSKIFVLSSIYEGLGNVLIDATNYRLPIITTNCKSGPPEIIDFGKGGFLVPISDPSQLSKKIIYALNNYEIAIKKSNYAKKRVNRFLIENNSNKYLNYIMKVFNE